ncbi:MAG: hypothetical protein KDE33_15875 [Bacteroidetes bacterium]|nr:hypothetical protein [Bacteroidota bacterium]
MIFEPKIFYKTYLKDYHKTKAIYLKKIIDYLPKYESDFFEKELTPSDRNEFKRMLKSDLRQTYFHSIETFFELFFVLNPKGKKILDDEFVLFNLTNAKWAKNYEKIQEIADNPKTLDFLDEKITFLDYSISIGHYLFYMGIFSKENFPPEIFEGIEESIDAIKFGITVLARDFSKKEEYNAYKHGLRIIPAVDKLKAIDAKTMKKSIEFDLSESMSFYQKTSNPNEITIITKLFDSERDFAMTYFCSNLIGHLIKFREIAFDKNKDKKKDERFPITFFGKEPIEKCTKINVEVQDIKYTIKRN